MSRHTYFRCDFCKTESRGRNGDEVIYTYTLQLYKKDTRVKAVLAGISDGSVDVCTGCAQKMLAAVGFELDPEVVQCEGQPVMALRRIKGAPAAGVKEVDALMTEADQASRFEDPMREETE